MIKFILNKAFKEEHYSKLNKELNDLFTKENITPLPEFSILLWHFTSELYKLCIKNNIDELFFLSRDGFFLKELFEEYQNFYSGLDKKLIKLHYIETSRRASLIASLQDLEREDFNKLHGKRRSIKQFCILYSLPTKEINDICIQLKINFQKKIFSFINSAEFIKLKSNDAFSKIYETSRLRQKTAFKAYFKMFNIKKGEVIHLVDVGWKGTTQDNFYKILGDEYKFFGHYLGLRPKSQISIENNKEGVIFDYRKNQKAFHLVKFPGVFIQVEFLLSQDDGSVVGYNIDQKTNQVQLDKEYNADEIKFFNNHVMHYQQKVKANFKKLDSILKIHGSDVSKFEKFLYLQYAKCVLFSSSKDRKFFRDKYVVDGLNFNKKVPFHAFSTIRFLKIPDRIIAYFRWFVIYFKSRKFKIYFTEQSFNE